MAESGKEWSPNTAMDPHASAGKVLKMPELLTSILRYLGPVDWLPCSAVCSWWSTALHDNGTPSPEARANNLWRDFAEILMSFSCWRRPSCRKNTYKTVCLEGNPAVLGPPLRVTGDDNNAIVMLSSVAEASLARSRRPRALVKFLLQWGSYGPVVPSASGDARRARVLVCEDSIRFVYPRNFGRSGSTSSREAIIPGVGSSANRAAKKADRRRSKTLPSVLATTAMVNDGLRVFTRNFVLCRRCRSPRTTLCASEHQSAFGVSRSKVLSGSGELLLLVECQEDHCGLAFGVHVDRKSSPLWLTKFTEYVLHRTWEDINTFEADHGTEWFSDTSPEAVQRRQEEARAESLGLDALVNSTGNSNPRKESR